MLISHGTGCIVAYDILWELSHDPELTERSYLPKEKRPDLAKGFETDPVER